VAQSSGIQGEEIFRNEAGSCYLFTGDKGMLVHHSFWFDVSGNANESQFHVPAV
jgi:hypothetical protein